ncbi:MFS transporter [Neobacillus cucumis]|uniref:MFS transporter n=1 Tax=Neobacillus cucumis TaxID=1740721 RepID=UPI0018E00CB7|nr:MFS transporter [Neobacillus cucumis]MBI0580782.1 MFS transporter [Neobacillus cucumis]
MLGHKRAFLYLSTFLFFFHSSSTVISTFLPVYFQEEQLTGTQIGWLMAVGPFSSLLSQPFWGYISDRYKTIKKILLFCLVGVISFSIILFQVNSFLMLLFLCAIFYSFLSPIGAFGDSLALHTSQIVGSSFGRIRMWGSVGYAVTSYLGGQILTRIGLEHLLYPYLAFTIIAFVFCWKVMDINTPSAPINLKGAVRNILRPNFLFFLLIIMFVTIPHRTNDIFSGIFIKELGGNESLIGLSWFVAVAFEAIVYLLSPLWMRFFNEITYMVIASGLYGVRWLLFSLAETPSQIILLQALHGITFGIFYLCSFQYVSNLFPNEFRATGQLFFISVFFGLSAIIGSLGGGMILDVFNGQMLYKLMSYLAFTGFVGLLGFIAYSGKKLRPGREILQK